MTRLIDAAGIVVTTIFALSLLSPSPSFIAPVLSVEAFQDSNSHHAVKSGTGSCEADDHASSDCSTDSNNAYSYRTVQVQVIHRHGDRTPITPLKNEEFWAQQLVPEELLERVAMGTRVLRHQYNNGSGKNKLEVHAAAGRGPFGKLTKLGLLGMIQVGTNLKEDLEESTMWSEDTTASSVVETTSTAPGADETSSSDSTRRIRFKPNDIKVYSTDFARTIQSVQGLLVGFFPDGFTTSTDADTVIDIDCRGTTSWMIPDPQPRQTKEQEDLERQLAQRPHVLEREVQMRPLAVRVTQSLLPLLGEEAFKISFGVEDNEDGDVSKKTLPWIQLTEITKCLSVRDMLPDSITVDDQEALSAHTAWKWFQSLRSPRLAYLSMRRFTETLVSTMRRREEEPPLILYSCHDSSLIGLLCALRLEQPSVWPEYGAVLKIELLEKTKEKIQNVETTSDTGDSGDINYVLRFFLNGELLRSMWHDQPREEISMEEFASFVSLEGKGLETS